MTELKATPGPWRYNFETDGKVVAVSERGPDITVVEADAASPENARLIAAAPELYEALEDMLAGWRYIRQAHGDLYGVGWDRAQEKAEAALAKARSKL